MTAEFLAVQLGAGMLYQIIASTDDGDRAWQVATHYENRTDGVLLMIDDAETDLSPGTRTVSGTGSTVALGITYGRSPFVKIQANPWGHQGGELYPVKTTVLGDTEFSFNLTSTPASVPVDLEFALDDSAAPGAVVELMVDDRAVGTLPSGLSSRTVIGHRIGLWVLLRDPASQLSLTMQHDAPTTYWELSGTDQVSGTGVVGPSPAALLVSRSARSAQLVGLLRYDRDGGGLKPSWVAAHSPLPGGWAAADTDLYTAAGDLDGDGSNEVLVRSVDLTVGGRVGVLRHDPQTGGLAAAWTGKDVLPGGWSVDARDAWYPVGDLDGTGGGWLLVRNLPSARDPQSRIGLARLDRVGGLDVAWIGSDTLPGGWTISTVCSYAGTDADGYLGIGDITGTGAAAILTWIRTQGDDSAALAVLTYQPAGRQLVAAWTCRERLPGGWALDSSDHFVLAGRGWSTDHRPAVLVQRRAGDLPAALGLLTFDADTCAVGVTWTVTGRIRGDWTLTTGDIIVPIGDVDGDGIEELLVRGRDAHGTPVLAVLRPVEGGVVADTAISGVLDGWTLDPADVVVPLGDVDGDRRAEILVRSRPADGPGELALLRYSPVTGTLQVAWRAGGTIPGDWS